jgi:hypothetical protein
MSHSFKASKINLELVKDTGMSFFRRCYAGKLPGGRVRL